MRFFLNNKEVSEKEYRKVYPEVKPEVKPDWRLSHKLYLNEGSMDYEFFEDYLEKYAPSALKKIINQQKKKWPDELIEY